MTRTLRLLGIVAANTLVQVGAILSDALIQNEYEYQQSLKEQRRARKLEGADIPDWTKKVFRGPSEKRGDPR